MICSLEATSKAPQKAFATVVRGRCFPVGSEPAHTSIAPQARPIAFRYAASAPLIIALSLHLVAGSTPMTATVESGNNRFAAHCPWQEILRTVF
jgi:hypothetical protein